MSSNLEYLLLKIKEHRYSFIIGVFYNPPGSAIANVIDDFDNILALVYHTVDWISCLGDFNVNLFNHNNPISHCFGSFGFSQIIDVPTRITATTSTLIDGIFVSSTDFICNVGTLSMHGISDHEMTFVEIKGPTLTHSPKIINYRCFRNFDMNDFLADLTSLPWHNIIVQDDIDKKIELFNEYVIAAFDKNAPIITRRVTKPPAPWLTDNLKLLKKERNKALRKFKRTKNEADFGSYKELRNLTLAATRNEKKGYLDHILQKNDSKATWSTLRDFAITSNRNMALPNSLADPNLISNYFAPHIQNVTNRCDEKIEYYNSNFCDPNVIFKFRMITIEEVGQFLNLLKTNAIGGDKINLKMLRYCSPFVNKYIVHIINCCIERSYFPSIWKQAIGIPIPKNKNITDLSDLRVISILPTVSKIMEKFLYSQIYEFFTVNNLLPDIQCGFRAGRSTETALASMTTDILTAYDQGQCSALVLLDFSRAFDTISHELLCAKLKYFGFDDSSLFLIWNYLLNRNQRMRVNGRYSSSVDILSGVPQGSILGPLLFIIYTADVLNSIDGLKVQAYADDTQLYHSFYQKDMRLAEGMMNRELNKIITLSEEHNLKLNPKKSKLIFFGNKNNINLLKTNMVLKMGDNTLEVNESVRNLGLLMDSDMRFSQYVRNLIGKAFGSLKIIYASRHILNLKTKRMLCEALVLSHFNYCDFIYGNCLTQADRMRIQKVQNSCCRLIYGIRKSEHISHKVKECNWLTMENRRRHHLGVFTYKLLNNMNPPKLVSKLKPRFSIHTRNIRQKSKLTMPQHRTAMFQRCFIYQAIRLFNTLPDEFRLFNINKFKYKFKLCLLDQQN